jgi:hypothetical protein
MNPDDMFAKAYDELQAGGGGGESEAPPPSPVEEAPEPAATETTAPAAEPAQESGRVRDGKGRFTKTEGKPAPLEVAPATPAPADQGGASPASPVVPQAAPPALPEIKAPRDWKLAAREKWAQLPREVQEEAFRNHLEVRKALDRAAELSKGFDPYRQATAPYEAMIRAEGLEPHAAIGLLLQREAALRTAPMATRAQIIAHGIKTFLGTDDAAIDLLAKAIDSSHGQPGNGAAGPQAPIDPRQLIAQAKQEFARDMEARRNEMASQSAMSEMEAFSASHEFLDDVDPETGWTLREEMANILEADVRAHPDKQTPMPIEQAYNLACKRHSEVSKTLAQREAAKAAAAKAAQAKAGRTAAAGLKNEPAGVQVRRARNDTEAAAEAYDQLANQRV